MILALCTVTLSELTGQAVGTMHCPYLKTCTLLKRAKQNCITPQRINTMNVVNIFNVIILFVLTRRYQKMKSKKKQKTKHIYTLGYPSGMSTPTL